MWNQYMREYVSNVTISDECIFSLFCSISEIITWRFFRPYITDFIFQFTPKGYAFQKHLKQVHNFTRKVVAERKKHLKDNNLNNESKANKANNKLLGKKERMSFLDLLLNSSESSDVLNDQDIAEEVDTFMFEVLRSFKRRS